MKNLKEHRKSWIPPLPKLLQGFSILGAHTAGGSEQEPHEIVFSPKGPYLEGVAKKVGVLFSGGPAPGGHNVITGLFDFIKRFHPDSSLIGFLGGASGLLEGRYKVLDYKLLKDFRNQPGFHLLGSGRTKIKSEEHFAAAEKVVQSLQLDTLVIIGGDDSNTNAWALSEHFKKKGVATQVIGVPKTIDGDLQNERVEISFGFDTACRLYSELISNIACDAASAGKYYHFIRLMGRTASHVTLECALQTHPHLAIIAEEVKQKGWSLNNVVQHIVDMIQRRAEAKKFYGVILLPEGLLEFIPEVSVLINELNILLGQNSIKSVIDALAHIEDKEKAVVSRLSEEAAELFTSLPRELQKNLLEDRDPHGNVQFSHIATEELIEELVVREVKARKAAGKFTGAFASQTHFFGYEGRCAYPTNFDATYCYALGATVALLALAGVTGFMAYVGRLTEKVEDWSLGGIALQQLIHNEERAGVTTSVIKKKLVDLNAPLFKYFSCLRNDWILEDATEYIGPIQFFGPDEVCYEPPLSLLFKDGICQQ